MVRSLSLFFVFLLLASCSSKKPVTSTTFTLGFATGGLANPVMLYGVTLDNSDSFSRFVPAGSSFPIIELKQGDWDFGAISWDAATPFNGPMRCGLTNSMSVTGDEILVSLNLTSTKCLETDFAPFYVDYGKPFQLFSCKNLEGITGATDLCNGQKMGWSRSFRVGLVEYGPSGGAESVPAFTPCISKSDEFSPIPTSFFLPLGGPDTPIATVITAYDELGCTGTSRVISIKNGVAVNNLKSKAFDDGTTFNNIYIHDRGPVSLKLIGEMASNSCDYELDPITLDSGQTLMLMHDTTGGWSTNIHEWVPGGSINLLNDFNVGGDDSIYSQKAFGTNKHIFSAFDGAVTSTYVGDGTPSGFVNLGNFSFNDYKAVLHNGLMYFGAYDASMGSELVVSDGTLGGTTFIDIVAGLTGSNPENFIVYNNEVYFSADDGTNGAELWKTDGTPGGTVMVADICPGPGSSFIYDMAVFNGKLFLSANDCVAGQELHSFDGTAVTLEQDIEPAGGSSPTGFYVYGTKLFFSATNGTVGDEPYMYDGTTLTLISDINVGMAGSFPLIGGGMNGSVYIVANDGTNGGEPYRYDIANNSLISLGDLTAGATGSVISSSEEIFFPYGDYVFFSGYDSTGVTQIIYRTKGTAATTQPAFGLVPGTFNSFGKMQRDNRGNIFAKYRWFDGMDFANIFILR